MKRHTKQVMYGSCNEISPEKRKRRREKKCPHELVASTFSGRIIMVMGQKVTIPKSRFFETTFQTWCLPKVNKKKTTTIKFALRQNVTVCYEISENLFFNNNSRVE